MSHSTFYDWSIKDSDFAAAVEESREMHIESLEREVDRRAVEGVRRLKFHQGKPVIDPETGKPYYEHVYSDLLLIFRLKALKPEMYRERHEVSLSDVELNREIEKLMAELQGKAAANGRAN